MNILVFDTETISLNKPFCYNIGYLIYDTDTDDILTKQDYVVEQIWHNLPLFSTAYYADKRPIYVSKMRGKTATLKKWGHITQKMINDIKKYDVQAAFAYNSEFDEKVIDFNSDYFKIVNPFDTIPIHDIRGHIMKAFAFTPEYQQFCETNQRFTESGNYSTTAETVFQYVIGDTTFEEAHTALADAEIEAAILLECVNKGCEWDADYKVYRSVPRKTLKELNVYIDGEFANKFEYISKTTRGNKLHLKTK